MEGPDVVFLPIYDAFLRREAEDAVGFLAETVAFIKGQELEEWAFVFFLEFVRFLKEALFFRNSVIIGIMVANFGQICCIS